jgi:hypothetical protein
MSCQVNVKNGLDDSNDPFLLLAFAFSTMPHNPNFPLRRDSRNGPIRENVGSQMKKHSFPPPTAYLRSAILGIWKLKSREDVDDAGQIQIDPFLGRDPLGILCFGPTHFAAQFMRRDRSQQEKVLERPQAKNNTAGVDGYDAYFGTYSVDESAGTLTTHLEASISPANIGATYVRDVRVANDELFIRLNTTALDGTAITRTNTFSRVG